MKNSKGQTLYQIVSFDNTDGNLTSNPSPLACNLPRKTAIGMLATYRAIKHEAGQQFRYIMVKQ